MNPFAVVERWCAERVDRAFARVFPGRLEPVQVARRLVAALEATTPPPVRYDVAMHPNDFAALEPEIADLKASWERMLDEMARRLALPTAEAARVAVRADAGVVPGGVRVEATPGRAIMRLRVLRGIPADGVVEVEGEVVAGRAPESGLALFDPSVSRRHARFARRGETLELEDLGSANGSYVDGRRVERGTLRRGDVVRLGDCELRVE